MVCPEPGKAGLWRQVLGDGKVRGRAEGREIMAGGRWERVDHRRASPGTGDGARILHLGQILSPVPDPVEPLHGPLGFALVILVVEIQVAL